MTPLSHLRASLALLVIVQTVAGGLVKRDDPPKVFVPQRVNIPVKQGSAGQWIMPVNMATGDDTQHFNFTLTMSSGLTFVAGHGCTTCGNIATYDQDKSTTARSLNTNISTNFFSEVTSGAVIKETCSIQTSNGSSWVYPNQTVVVVNNQNATSIGQILGEAGVSGLVGLGANLVPQSSSQGGLRPGLNDSIYGQWLHNNPTALNFTFGMALQPPAVRRNNASATDTATGNNAGSGILNWLQPDTSMFQPDQVVYKTVNNGASGGSAANNQNGSVLPSNSPSQEWSLSLDGWKLTSGDDIISNSKQIVASVEALYTELYFPQDQAKLIHAAIPGSQLHTDKGSLGSASQAYTIPCDSKFTFGFVVGGQTFTLDHNALVIPVSGGQCVSAIEGWSDESETTYMLGTTFISAVYLIFQITRDGQQIVGFAPFADSPKKSHVGAIVGGVIGGVAFVVFVAIATFFFSRRYYRRSTLGTFDPQLDETKAAPTPYTLGAPTQDARYSMPAGSVITRQSYMPTSPGHSSADALFMEASSAGSQYATEGTSPPAYDASEAAYNPTTPGVVSPRPQIREKGHHSRPSTQEGAVNGAGPSA